MDRKLSFIVNSKWRRDCTRLIRTIFSIVHIFMSEGEVNMYGLIDVCVESSPPVIVAFLMGKL